MNAGHISSAVAPFRPLIAVQATLDGSSTTWTTAAHRLFTITGIVKIISLFGDVTEALTEGNGDETIEVGIAGDTAILIDQLAAPLSLVAGDVWAKGTALPAAVIADPVVIQDIDIDILVAGTTGITNGQITFYVEWVPMTDGALVIGATWD